MTAYLLDTHTLLWLALEERPLLSRAVRDRLFQANLFASVVSAAEIAIKHAVGKFDLPPPLMTSLGGGFRAMLARADVGLLPFDLEAADQLARLPLHHRDPFDRMLIAQALQNGLAVATRDRAFHAYDGLEILEV